MTSANVYIGTSLDGFIARTNGDFGWLMKFADANAVESYNEFMAGIDAIVIGRGTFETVLGFPTCRGLCTTVVHDTGHVPEAGTWPVLCMLKNRSPYPAAVFPSCGGQTAHSHGLPMTRSQFDPL